MIGRARRPRPPRAPDPKSYESKPKVFTKQPFVGSASTPGALWRQVRANPSLKRTRQRLAAPGRSVILPSAASLRRSAYLKRYASPAESESKLALFHAAPQASEAWVRWVGRCQVSCAASGKLRESTFQLWLFPPVRQRQHGRPVLRQSAHRLLPSSGLSSRQGCRRGA